MAGRGCCGWVVVEKKKGNQARVQMYTQHWREEKEMLNMMLLLTMLLLMMLLLMRRCRRLLCQWRRRRPPVAGLLQVCVQRCT